MYVSICVCTLARTCVRAGGGGDGGGSRQTNRARRREIDRRSEREERKYVCVLRARAFVHVCVQRVCANNYMYTCTRVTEYMHGLCVQRHMYFHVCKMYTHRTHHTLT